MINQRAGDGLIGGDGDFKLRELIPFFAAVITGALGGCAACIAHARTRREVVAAYSFSYCMTGAFGGLMTVAVSAIMRPELIADWSTLLLISGISGAITSLALAAGNFSMGFVLKKLGLEVVINVKRIDEENRK